VRPSLIAIDGPVASGKNAVGSLLAQKLGYRFIDTGAMYRALTWLALERGLDLGDEAVLAELARTASIALASLKDGTVCTVQVEGQDVSAEMVKGRVERAVSLVAKVTGVRRVLVERQRRMAQGGGVVMVGRDIGTVVLPQAQLKLYLVASARERACRRYLEFLGRGEPAEYAEVLADLERRDRIDSQRSDSPLKPAPDAHIIETDGLGIEEVLKKILDIIEADSCPSSTTPASP